MTVNPGDLPVLAADLRFARVNGGRVCADLIKWNENTDPVVGQHVLLAGGDRPEAVITEIRGDGTIVLRLGAPEPAAAGARSASTSPGGRGDTSIAKAEHGPVSGVLAEFGYEFTDAQVADVLRAVLDGARQRPWVVGIENSHTKEFTGEVQRYVTEAEAREAAGLWGSERGGVRVRHLPQLTAAERATAFGEFVACLQRRL